MSVKPITRKRVHPVDEVLPVPKLAAYGFQHVVAFYAGAVLVPIIIGSAIGLTNEQLIHLINADLFTCGIASIIQSVGFWKIGVRLPLLQGVTFAGVSPVIAIAMANGGGTEGLLYVYGAVIVAGLVTFFMAPYFSRLLRFFPPVVTGTVITIIGVALLPVAVNDAVTNPATHEQDPTNGRWMAYAIGTLLIIVLIQRFFKGFMATIAVLLGLVIGSAVAFVLGDMNFDGTAESSWVGFTQPFLFGVPKFSVVAIISMIVVMLIIAVETTGSVYATGEIVGKRIKKDDIAATLRADGVATVIGGTFNSFPYTAFSENVGLVRLTGVRSRWVVASAGGIMILLGLLPKTAAVVASIPPPVLGGAALALFATVAVVGIQTLSKVDFTDHRNLIIVATSLGLAMLVTIQPTVSQGVPDWLEMLFGSGIVLGAVSAIVLNVLFFHIGNRGQAVAGGPGAGITLDRVNEMSAEEFAATFGGLVQGTPWVVERAYQQRPFADAHGLREAFQEALLAGTTEEQIELINSYPDLGSEDATGTLNAADHVGLSNLEEDEHENIVQLAAEYRRHFGFPLVICARETERYDRVLANGWSRVENAPSAERSFAMIEIAKIANYRFDDLVADANPIAAARFGRINDFR
ncbi:2-oxo-4-hydroxy-4-carboxy-5-ureidoimidazoline decarboxylase [Rhodococcus fascians]|uniref:2-oxo-4-hydroxy-4-carboxy-5-ureidoimidazoline decarboxylase n=1 Tax=Rhodococcoides fascians TaxID=1828 RepID=UPI001C907A26|nr:2-oxo-4-hydroxy-4-carboxy-5-ureidoimidazoline decarboxylase [Rhodococcus fascians]MBY3989518.1 2-oxo-4-hydroxy-4-carboxy-5-ureidoimidazoline decarboxylase [Rhodococcus fascians]MBY3999372.1 2-oxo-4-hydroxy-4-carboxy-5-ureidoimidazoline decarboxylase [Rhodococcus fascians]MBY4001347.1 2-oxo-4-hydroxy-4-carboxy-5-ureidoimidazoline decarboxylase [Rhodococcus fascians]MBY4010067.1 2-oxo-4-hydroxy-4-carboxy-5-ureidoimidazoline decarboxylase [Rhodococcus fascians]MBY4015231.1 2-oxo-4-hydroxy-4-ca